MKPRFKRKAMLKMQQGNKCTWFPGILYRPVLCTSAGFYFFFLTNEGTQLYWTSNMIQKQSLKSPQHSNLMRTYIFKLLSLKKKKLFMPSQQIKTSNEFLPQSLSITSAVSNSLTSASPVCKLLPREGFHASPHLPHGDDAYLLRLGYQS